ncbi:hypothetical protein F3Y22_tig00110831pilonHSYRG00109 [Hibiscus syriacus]|uniref:Reverse transcriptase zinc-binding domain-containing protein n=1 Tax=Hibiscus syriacus TaxID=106335 RepID=A0A6A2ZNX2_HIBSY|nr:hypothetical protein F3Y22_tig00110831pilonHSYRG00109 [Hibiscus syriacus]
MDSMWTQLFRTKYKILKTVLDSLDVKNGSFIYKSLAHSESWSSVQLKQWSTPSEHILVRDFVTIEGMWNLDLLGQVLDYEYLDLVTGVLVPHDDFRDDAPAWRWEPNGNCTVHLTYYQLRHNNWDPQNLTWALAWDFDGPQQIKQFHWLVIRNRMMTNMECHRRGLTSAATCPIYGKEDESIPHVLRDCTQARLVWETLLPYSQIPLLVLLLLIGSVLISLRILP